MDTNMKCVNYGMIMDSLWKEEVMIIVQIKDYENSLITMVHYSK